MRMESVDVDGIRFTFASGWLVSRWDESAFHLRFCNVGSGTKSCDLVAIPPEGDEIWLVEVKDYSEHGRMKSIALETEVAEKVKGTLSGLWAAWNQANADDERDLARRARRRKEIRVVLHLEQRAVASRLFPGIKLGADFQMKLKQAVHPIDPHPVVSSVARPGKVVWSTERVV
jgi:hypothetical protein